MNLDGDKRKILLKPCTLIFLRDGPLTLNNTPTVLITAYQLITCLDVHTI